MARSKKSAEVRELCFTVLKNQTEEQDCTPHVCSPEYKLLGGGLGRNTYEWQPEAFRQLLPQRLRRLLAPTGCGKSLFMRAMSWYDAANHKVLIVVPQIIIAETAFGPEKIQVPKGPKFHWIPTNKYNTDESTIQFLVDQFADVPVSELPTPTSRIVVCTHSTFVRAHERLMAAGKKWVNVSLIVDEAHFMKGAEYEEEDGSVEVDPNRLGEAVLHWLDENVGPLMLVTATWVRGDLTSILPKDRLEEFRAGTYQRTADRHFSSMRYLREIEFGYLMATPAAALKYLHASGADRKTILFARSIQAMGGEGDSQQRKKAYVADCLTGLGQHTAEGHLTVHQTGDRRVKCLDLISTDSRYERGPDGTLKLISDTRRRDGRKAQFIRDLRNPKAAHNLPSVVLALIIGKLGLDYNVCDSVLVDRARDNYGDMLQMFGRALRDVPGKTKASIFILLEPLDPDDPKYLEKLRSYTRAVMGSMIIEWQFRAPKINGVTEKPLTKKQREAIDVVRGDPGALGAIIDEIERAALKPNVGVDDTENLDEIIQRAFPDFDPEEVEGVRGALVDEIPKKLRYVRDVHNPDEVPYDPEFRTSAMDAVRAFVMKLDPEALGRLREQFETMPKYENLRREVIKRGIRNIEAYRQATSGITGAPLRPDKTYGKKFWDNGGWPGFFGQNTVKRYPKVKRV